MAIAHINPKVIAWALKRSGAALESLVTPKVSLDRIKSWEQGKTFPSETDAKALADRLGIAYPMLYMPELPEDQSIGVPDLRTVDGRPLRNPSLNLLDVLDMTRARQEWYRSEVIPANAKKLSFVGRFSNTQISTSVMAQNMRMVLGIDGATLTNTQNYADFLKVLVSKAESLGILVMRSSIVGHSTSRVLSVDEFRGFALIDPFVPVIFINDNDAKAAQIFTLIHELAHIWLGVSGVSDRKPDTKGDSSNHIEIRCDQITAEFLTPENEFSQVWSASRALEANMLDAARHFRVSTLVVLRRAFDLKRIPSKTFFDAVAVQYQKYREHEEAKAKRQDKKKSGGNFWASFELRNGAKFNAAVAESIRRQRTTYAEAGTLFGVTPVTAGRYLDRVGVGK